MTSWRVLGLVVMSNVSLACSAKDANGVPASSRTDSHTSRKALDARPNMTTNLTCEDARRAIESRRLQGWQGLPAGCSPQQLFGVPLDDEWGARRLGGVDARQRLLDLPGYHRPLVSVRDDQVVMFDAAYPDLDGGWDALRADLGDPPHRFDYQDGSIDVVGGEWVYPGRGIAVFVSSDASKVYHLAMFAATTIDEYQAVLRPRYGTTRRPGR